MNTRNLVACVSVALAACGGDGGGGIPAAGMASARAAAPIPSGSSIYVDCSQSNDGTGSQASPFNRLADLATTIGAGTHLYFKRGATCAGQFVSQGSGTAAAPIVVAAYGTGTARPVIAGNVAGHGAAGAAVALTNQEYWEIHDLEITNTAAQRAERNGILVLLQGFQNGTDAGGNPVGVGHHYLIDNVYVHDVYGNNDDRNDQNATPGVTGNKWSNGIQFRVTGTAIPNRFDGVTVQNSEIATVDREGLTTWSDQNCRTQFGCTGTQNWLASTNVVFKGNTIHDIGGDGIVIRASQNAQVYGNLGYDIAMRALNSNAGFWTINSDGTDFQYNEVHHVRRGTGNNDGEAFDADYGNNNPIFRHNYSHDNAGGFLLLCGGCGGSAYTQGVVARYNLSVNDAREIVMADGSGKFNSDGSVTGPLQFYNNTIYLPAGSTAAITATQNSAYKTAIQFSNNIVDNLGTGGYLAASANFVPTWRNNLFFGSNHTGDPSDATEVAGDPLFAGPLTDASGNAPTGFAGATYDNYAALAGFRISAQSPAASKGSMIELPSTVDLFQNPLPTKCAPDIGAHQVTPVPASCAS
ncbi:right-handed parallel beta-helix repeat-containing protein [Burkholderia stabilis]|uniref:right-handed parallel beta-helix repeat-containing protein n=1 Tax=Burkholderia stabilis TaxID=95485 RepID=UPI001F4BBA46|nr:right-handed parallel beta-helix repeat-containing protein [Burkholderia stabilis]